VFPTDYDSFVFSNIFFTEDMLENHADEQQVQKLLKGNTNKKVKKMEWLSQQYYDLHVSLPFNFSFSSWQKTPSSIRRIAVLWIPFMLLQSRSYILWSVVPFLTLKASLYHQLSSQVFFDWGNTLLALWKSTCQKMHFSPHRHLRPSPHVRMPFPVFWCYFLHGFIILMS